MASAEGGGASTAAAGEGEAPAGSPTAAAAGCSSPISVAVASAAVAVAVATDSAFIAGMGSTTAGGGWGLLGLENGAASAVGGASCAVAPGGAGGAPAVLLTSMVGGLLVLVAYPGWVVSSRGRRRAGAGAVRQGVEGVVGTHIGDAHRYGLRLTFGSRGLRRMLHAGKHARKGGVK